MKLFDYVDKYGDYTFDKFPFNLVDAAIFSYISYCNFHKIVDKDKITIEKAGKKHQTKNKNKLAKEIIAVREGSNLLYHIMDKNRYKNCNLMKYVYQADDRIQFCALSIEFMKNTVFVSFEGTDEFFSGWIENFNLSYSFPTISHMHAINYLNRNYTFKNVKLYVGGHSKGGNLAQVASTYSNFLVKSKIEKIYSFDGPGLLDKQFNSNKWKRSINKYIHVIPNSSLVGILLNNNKDYVIKSTARSPYSHSILTWEVNEEGEFEKTKLNEYSKEVKKNIMKWVKKYSREEKEEFVKNLDDVLEKSGVKTIVDLKENYRNVLNILKETKDITNENKKRILDLVGVFINAFQEVTINKIKTSIKKIKKEEK